MGGYNDDAVAGVAASDVDSNFTCNMKMMLTIMSVCSTKDIAVMFANKTFKDDVH